jgi:hypothetical protein
LFAKGHVKGTTDGIGQLVTEMAAKVSEQKGYSNKILTPYEFFG